MGVRVTVLDPRRAPAATGTVKSSMLWKSVPASAPFPVTVTDTCAGEVSSEERASGNSTASVIEAGSSPSPTDVLLSPSRKRESGSRMVRAAGLTVYPFNEDDRVTVSGPSSTVSAAALKLMAAVPLPWLAGMVTSTEAGAVKSEASAVSAAMETVKVASDVSAAAPYGTAALTVTVRTLPSST